MVHRLGWLPMPLLTLVVFLIADSQMQTVLAALPVRSARALTFSLGTRNSFVMLPLALALTPGWRAAVVVIVVQSLIELFGMLAYLKAVPRLLPDRRGRGAV